MEKLKEIKNLKLKIVFSVLFLILMITQIGPYILFADENDMTFSFSVLTTYANNDYYEINVPVLKGYLDQNLGYCLDYQIKQPDQGSTVKFIKYLSSVNTAVLRYGYPYSTPEQLGVANKEEAFTATKQAVYCYIHGNNPNDYTGIGEAGTRTLNAMNKIISDAQNSTETKISSTITVNKEKEEWNQDNIEKEYVSKIYSVSAGSNISDYKVSLTKENSQNLGGIKLTDENNNEKSEFKPNEKFKILIPIKNLTEDAKIIINVESTVETKPVLYGTAPDSGHQDYALTAATFENGSGSTKDTVYKNETRIVIIKKDQETGKILKDVEFQLLDKDKNVVYSDLKTDENGKIVIENLIPGGYYIKETKAIEGYKRYEQLIKVDAELNQEVTVTVNNSKEEEPKIETKTEKNKSVASKTVKKLPVTGM